MDSIDKKFIHRYNLYMEVAFLKAFQTRRENLIQTHTNYSATDLEISKNMIIGCFDDVVYFIATPDNSIVESIIKR